MTPDEDVELFLTIFKVAAGVSFAWLSASALKARKKALRNRLDILFSDSDVLDSRQIVSLDSSNITRLGAIKKHQSDLTFEFIEEGRQLDYRAFSKLEELERYLEEHTCFRIGDFARPSTITGN